MCSSVPYLKHKAFQLQNCAEFSSHAFCSLCQVFVIFGVVAVLNIIVKTGPASSNAAM
jgi:hypothetical protein